MAGFSIRNPFFIVVCCLILCVVLADGEVNVLRMAVAQDAELHLRSRIGSSDGELEIAAVHHLLAIELTDDISVLQTGAGSR